MSQHPIYLDVEEEIPELIEKLRDTTVAEVPVVIPARSRFGQSRFNFRLLRDYGREYGKRIAIISVEPEVQRLASENGFNVFAHLDEYETPGVERTLVAGGARAASASAVAARSPAVFGWSSRAAATLPRLSVGRQARRLAAGTSGSRFILYLGGALLALVFLIGMIVLVPSATVTLTAHAQPVSSTANIDAAPNSAPIRVRILSARKDASRQFKATGLKVTPAVASSGTAVFSNKCPWISVRVSQGQIVSTSTGIQFVVQSTVDSVGSGQTASAPILANLAGPAGNVGAGSITIINNEPAIIGTCFSVSNPAPTANGADEVRQTFVSQADLDSARAQIEGDLRGTIVDDLSKQATGGEKLSDAIDYKSDFAADHKANDPVSVFNGTVSMTGSGPAYNVDDVRRAMAAELGRHVPAGFLMTDNPVQTDLHVTQASPDGHISFTGTSRGFVAPKLDFDKVRGRLTGSSTASARLYLGTLPVESVRVREKPVSLPVLPLLASRIDIRYVVDTSPGQPAG